jgi:hypothetical protein
MVYSELRRNNMQVSNYQFTDATLSNASPFEILEAFHKKISDAMPEKVKAPAHMIMVIVEGRQRSNPHYNEIKYWGDCARGVPTQIVAAELLVKPKRHWRSIVSNLCMKINSRLGGINVQFSSWNELPLGQRVCKNIKPITTRLRFAHGSEGRMHMSLYVSD